MDGPNKDHPKGVPNATGSLGLLLQVLAGHSNRGTSPPSFLFELFVLSIVQEDVYTLR